jgi:UDPglucose--hexose-1-phosphate uridylyltransferase
MVMVDEVIPASGLHCMEGTWQKRTRMYDKMNSVGANEIIIDSPEHNKQPEDMGIEQMQRIIRLYRDRAVIWKRTMFALYPHIHTGEGRRRRTAFPIQRSWRCP